MDWRSVAHHDCRAPRFCRSTPSIAAVQSRFRKVNQSREALFPSGKLICASYRWSGGRSGSERTSDGVFDNVDDSVEEESEQQEAAPRRRRRRPDVGRPPRDSGGGTRKASSSNWQEGTFEEGGWGVDPRDIIEDDWGRDGQTYRRKTSGKGADAAGDEGRSRSEWGSPAGRFEENVEDNVSGQFAEGRRWGATSSKSSRISMLRGDEKGMLLGLIPTGPQADYYAPKEASENVAWWGGTIGVVILLSKFPLLAALATGSPFLGPWAMAGLRNFELISKGSSFSGIWHAEIMDSELLDLRPESFGSRPPAKTVDGQSVRLVIGDPWKGGIRVEIVVPYTMSLGPLDPGTPVELLVLSDDKKFSTFKVVREVFLPETRGWLSDYPFVDRDVFVRLSYQISQQNPRDADKWSW
ncbi:hypothetical protein BSKO_12345 [Bryopsis sp. KO-2023]|nr:hypothetical protein BSKO_12345 [Bryopsis sp. KO-2023]